MLAILEGVRAYNDPGLQQHACAALHIIAKNVDNREKIVAVGGIRVVLAAMPANDSEAGIQEAGCWILAYLACNTDNQTVIATVGGISVVKAAMTAHTGLVGVQRPGCQALANLALNNVDNETAIVSAGGIPWRWQR